MPSHPGNGTWLEAEVAGCLPSILPLSLLANRDLIPPAATARKERPHFGLPCSQERPMQYVRGYWVGLPAKF